MKFIRSLQTDSKYLLAYLVPLVALAGLHQAGWWSPAAIYLAFIAVPLLELFTGGSSWNFPPEEEPSRSRRVFFDALLYLNVPILYALLAYFALRVQGGGLSGWEIAGMVLSMGVVAGSGGINVGHELGHRARRFEQVLAWLLLLPSLYLHFFIEHNLGHHRWVGTEKDPATARKSEWLYAFWLRSLAGGWLSAWRIEASLLRKQGHGSLHWRNRMLWFQGAQLLYLSAWYAWAGLPGVALALGVALAGALLLETINYIEHYGLVRRMLPGGHYEPVLPAHSWNSDHHVGRILLYELSRHSDHHYRASRKYQILKHFDDSPQLPQGYPACMLLALLPPLWFRVMDRRVDAWNQRRGN